MNKPALYFTKTHKETGVTFEDPFSNKNLPNWYKTPFGELMALAKNRIEYWNNQLGTQWEYKIVGWRIEE